MKKLAYVLIILLATPVVTLAEPYYNYDDYGNYIGEPEPPIVFDNSENVKLFNKLRDEYRKKYIVKETSTQIIYNAGANTFQKEVLTPYYKQCKSDEVLIQEALAKKKKKNN